MNLNQWAIKWGIPYAAIEDYRNNIGCMVDCNPQKKEEKSEAANQTIVRLEAAELGIKLFRNNVGVLINKNGTPVHYGLANESKKQNKQMKSADLIGLKPIKITQKHVGWVIGQFISREIKKDGWEYQATAAEQAQLRWAEFVLALGGDAAFATGRGTL